MKVEWFSVHSSNFNSAGTLILGHSPSLQLMPTALDCAKLEWEKSLSTILMPFRSHRTKSNRKICSP